MPITQITDHAAIAAGQLPSQFAGSPNLQDLLSVFAGRIQDLEDAAWSIYTGRPFAGAVNAQGDALSRWGQAVGEPRPASGTGSSYDTITVTPSVPLVTGNITTLTIASTRLIAGVASSWSPSTAPSVSSTALADVATMIAGQQGIQSAVVNAGGTAIVVAVVAGYQVTMSLATTGGASQPTWTVSEVIDDSVYWGIVKTKILVNTAEGTAETVLGILRDLGATGIQYQGIGHYDVQVSFGGTLAVSNQQAVQMLTAATPPISLSIVQESPSNPFRFDDTSPDDGFDQG